MKIKISLEKTGEWSDCWLETKYVNKDDIQFHCHIYPTTWPSFAKNDGHVMWMSSRCSVSSQIKNWVEDCKLSFNIKEKNK